VYLGGIRYVVADDLRKLHGQSMNALEIVECSLAGFGTLGTLDFGHDLILPPFL
jgi:hypothetical protein